MHSFSVLFLVCLYICVCECLLSSKQHSCVWGPLQECRLILSGDSGLPYYCTPLVWCTTCMRFCCCINISDDRLRTRVLFVGNISLHDVCMCKSNERTLQFTTGHVRPLSIVSLSTTSWHGLMLVRDSKSRCTSDFTLTVTRYTCYILTLTS